jgi:RNA polymerase sigma-70 factor (sigma-E family)
VTALLLEGARVAGDRDAVVEALFVAHYTPLVRLAAVLLDDVGTCEEVVQEAFVKLHAGFGRLHDRDKALAYLRQSVVNLSRSRLRRRLVARRYEDPQPGTQSSAEDSALAVLAANDLVRAMHQLQRRQREVLALRHLAGLSEAETAAALGISVGSVKAYASRGLDALRILMEAHR